MEKVDLRKRFKPLYAPSARGVEAVQVPRFSFAVLDGRIEPGRRPDSSAAFQDAIGALYGVSFTLKFMSKLRQAPRNLPERPALLPTGQTANDPAASGWSGVTAEEESPRKRGG